MHTSRAYRRWRRALRLRDAKRKYPDTRCPAKYADTMTPCSCYMCGNQRRTWGPNWQEVRARIKGTSEE